MRMIYYYMRKLNKKNIKEYIFDTAVKQFTLQLNKRAYNSDISSVLILLLRHENRGHDNSRILSDSQNWMIF